MRKITIKKALVDENISYRNFYSALRDVEVGNWDNVNSTDIMYDYINEMMRKGIFVSHILKAIEENDNYFDDWAIWLGNSMEVPEPINGKEDLLEALELSEDDLRKKINIE
jgi:hypothetical protein